MMRNKEEKIMLEAKDFIKHCDILLCEIERTADYIKYDIDNDVEYKFLISLIEDIDNGKKTYTTQLVMHISLLIGRVQERVKIG